MIQNREEIFKRAVEAFGEQSQTFKAIEELGELAAALARERMNPEYENVLHVIDEIADVYIMIHQLAIIYDKEKVDTQIAIKLRRLENLTRLV